MSKKVISLYGLLIKLAVSIATFTIMSGLIYAIPGPEGIQFYQKNIQLSPEHKKLTEDIIRYHNADNLWDVLREEFTLPHYENIPAVQEKIEWFMNNQDFLLRSASRAAPYLYYILQQIKKHHLPAELVLLPVIESGYNPFSRSPVGAAGIWQLMPGTASDWGIKQDWWYDGRRDVIASTRAALNYLAYLQSFFEGNWLLAIAAYDTGEGNVLSALKRNIREGKDTDFWSLPVAQETKDYVPSLLALAVIISKPDQYPIYFPPVRNAPYLAQVDIGQQINLKYAASLAGISYKKMMQLNSGFNRPSISTKGPYKLVLPIENVEQFTQNLARSPINLPVNWLHYKVKSGDTLASISKRFNTTINAIRKMNHLSKMNVHPGMNLLIPHQSITGFNNSLESAAVTPLNNKKHSSIKFFTRKRKTEDIVTIQTTQTEKPSNNYTLQPGDTIYMVRPNDTIGGIAKHFHISQLALTRVNHLTDNDIIPGKQIIIPLHPELLVQALVSEKSSGLKPGDTIYMVRHGDTIENIARKFHSSPAAVRITNLVDNDSLVEGEKLVIPTHLK